MRRLATLSLRSADTARTIARGAVMMAVGEVAVALYTILVGSFRLHIGSLRLSSWSMWSPLAQAVIFSGIALALFHREARLRGRWDSWPGWFLAGTARQSTIRILWGCAIVALVASVLVSSCIARQSIAIGDASGGWIYPTVRPWTWASLAMALLVTGITALALVASGRDLERHEWARVGAWVLLGIGLQAMLRTLTPVSFEQIFVNGQANSFYSVTQQYSAFTVLHDFDRLRQSWPIHARSNLPGKLMFLYALELISNRADIVAWLVVVVSNLGGVFVYLFVRDLFADRRVAFYALVLYAFVPGKLFFLPLLNVVTPAVVFACAWLALRWIRRGRLLDAVALGVALYGLVAFEPLPLVMGLLFAALVAAALRRGDLDGRRLVLQGGVAAGAFAMSWFVVRTLTGFDLLTAFRDVAVDARAFNIAARRPYALWARQNLVDFTLAAGVCQIVLFVGAFANSLRPSERTDAILAQPITLLCAAIATILIVTDLAGVNRAEVIRLWIFLACFFQIPAAWVCARLDTRVGIVLVIAATVLWDALGSSMIGFIQA